MGIQHGRLRTCDHCGKSVFEALVAASSWNNTYERVKEGWAWDADKVLCPGCAAEWEEIKGSFFGEKEKE